MIKIIKKGHIKHTETCPNCECVFEFEAEDVKRITAWDDHGGHYPVSDFYRIDCPFCNKVFDISMDETLMNEKDRMKHIDK